MWNRDMWCRHFVFVHHGDNFGDKFRKYGAPVALCVGRDKMCWATASNANTGIWGFLHWLRKKIDLP